MSKKKVAEIFVEMLSAAGIKRVYGITGDSLIGITENIRRHPEIEWLTVRHEETAAFAAGAEAQITGRLTACAGTCGPGNLHLINGLYDCHRSRVPVLAIAAHLPSAEIGSNYFQETDPEHLFKDCSHYCATVSQPEQMPRILEIAMRTAISKRGVAVIVISGDIALKDCPTQKIKLNLSEAQPAIVPGMTEVKKAAALLNRSSKITILGGAGCQGAQAELMQTAGLLQAPIVHALRGKEFIEGNNPYDIGMTGLLGYSSGYEAMMKSDTILMLGTDFPYRQFYPPHAKIIQVDIRGEQIGRRVKIDLGLIGDTKSTLNILNPLIVQKTDKRHLSSSLNHYKRVRRQLDRQAVPTRGRKPIHPQYVAQVINDLADANAAFTCDVGTPTVWAARYLRMNGQRRLIGSFLHGSMASALPQAIGIQAADPKRQVIALAGDGGLSMLLGDILTLKQHNLPVKIVVFNNNAFAFVELEMKAAGFMDFATELRNPKFSDIANAAGLLGLHADKPEQVMPLFKKMASHKGPALLEVAVNRQELIFPPKITKEQMEGFGLFMIKALLGGRTDELKKIIKTNLQR